MLYGVDSGLILSFFVVVKKKSISFRPKVVSHLLLVVVLISTQIHKWEI